ncbi:CapA family protein [Paenibacillus sp. OAS669]|uniref:CapA family protein n=1 Tax=Paenibacillus sp. OAS669 TaxID=2663821 RepID=UPI001A0C99FE|nr:CapA family protein [Paenibacillus sp. OAS669]MBE1441114.1 poly-gamma-glutamate synthesis protein (capsule biosynthesis protein) [Paenibacillus sp. OAS669]
MESRTQKQLEEKKNIRKTWITLGVLAVLTIASFSYLMNWLNKKDNPELSAPPVEVSPKGSGGAAPGNNLVNGSTVNTDSALNGNAKDPAPAADAADSGKQTVKLSFVGDVMFGSKVEDILKKNGWDYPYRYVKDYLSKADITVANLETPITMRGSAQSKDYVYRSSPQALPALQAAGIDLVNTANNHILDYGPEGLLDTLDELDKIGMKRVGTGRNSDEAYQSVIMERNGIKIAFLGFSRVAENTDWYAGKNKPGVAESYSTKLPLEAIAKARAEADLVVVIAHWGVERKDRPVKDQTDLAHKYIDQGADLVIASHPHVVQGFEVYKGKWIAYSLGNFIFTTNEEPATWESMVLHAECTKERTCELQMVPILTKWAQPVRMTDEDGAKLFDKLSSLSINAKVDKEGNITEGPPPPQPTPTPTPKPAAPTKKPAATDTKKDQGAPSQKSGITSDNGSTKSSGNNTGSSTSKPGEPQQTVKPKGSTSPKPTPTPTATPKPKTSAKPKPTLTPDSDSKDP